MRFLKILGSDFLHESRNERELEVVRSLGYSISILGRKTDSNHLFSIPDCTTVWKTVEPLHPFIKSKALNRAACLIPWAIQARKMKADVISCHDITYLFVGWLSTLWMSNKPKLVYDSHEFEYERADKRNRFLKEIIRKIEKFLMKRCAFSMMVNDIIADSVQELHHLKVRPIVVRNIPKKWKISADEAKKMRRDFLTKNNLPEDTFICMYHGIVVEGRGIENSIRALSKVTGCVLYILGNGSENAISFFKKVAKEEMVEDRVFFHPAVNGQELPIYVSMADLGMVLIEGVCKSYYYSLPNKLFENIQALTPVLGSDFPEIKKIIDEYGIGEIVNPEDVNLIAQRINVLRTNRDKYNKLKDNLLKAKDTLCWENERKVLENEYQKLIYEKK